MLVVGGEEKGVVEAEAGNKEEEEEESRDVQLDAGFLGSLSSILLCEKSPTFFTSDLS